MKSILPYIFIFSCITSFIYPESGFFELIGMCHGSMNTEQHAIRDKDISLLKQIQKEYEHSLPFLKIERSQETSNPTLIPKKIHFIWIGAKEFPSESIHNIQSWKKYNPEWEIYFWTDSQERALPIPGMIRKMISEYDFSMIQPLLEKSSNPGEISDLLRNVILYNEGGFYADHDAECFQSFDRFTSYFSFICCLERPHYHERIDSCVLPANGLFGSIPGHIILKKAIEETQRVWEIIEEKFPEDLPSNRVKKVIQRTFDSFAISALNWRNKNGAHDLILPTAYFYFDRTFTYEKRQELMKTGVIFSSHKFSGSWKK